MITEGARVQQVLLQKATNTFWWYKDVQGWAWSCNVCTRLCYKANRESVSLDVQLFFVDVYAGFST